MIVIDGHGWACTDCVQLLANGEEPTDYTATELAEYLARFERRTAGLLVTLGMPRSEHTCDTDRSGWDCDCERVSFMAGACDVCGANYGGERHAVSFATAG